MSKHTAAGQKGSKAGGLRCLLFVNMVIPELMVAKGCLQPHSGATSRNRQSKEGSQGVNKKINKSFGKDFL